jgi:hypothetical protein
MIFLRSCIVKCLLMSKLVFLLRLMFILWIKLNQRDIYFREFMVKFYLLWHTFMLKLLNYDIFTSVERWCGNIFLNMGNIALFYVMLLNNIIFTPTSWWCENIFLIWGILYFLCHIVKWSNFHFCPTVMWKYFVDEYYVNQYICLLYILCALNNKMIMCHTYILTLSSNIQCAHLWKYFKG